MDQFPSVHRTFKGGEGQAKIAKETVKEKGPRANQGHIGMEGRSPRQGRGRSYSITSENGKKLGKEGGRTQGRWCLYRSFIKGYRGVSKRGKWFREKATAWESVQLEGRENFITQNKGAGHAVEGTEAETKREKKKKKQHLSRNAQRVWLLLY